MVSVMSLLALIAAAFAFTGLAWPANALTGFAFMLAWHVVDGADGDLARMTGRASATGELVDGVCDYAGNVIIYVAFAFLLDDWIGAWAWILAVGGGRQPYRPDQPCRDPAPALSVAGLWRALAAGTPPPSGDAVFRRETWFTRYFGFWAVGYVWLSNRMTPSANPIDAALAKAEGDPRETERIRLMVRRESGPGLILAKAIGANPKTFLIGASMLAGQPALLFPGDDLRRQPHPAGVDPPPPQGRGRLAAAL